MKITKTKSGYTTVVDVGADQNGVRKKKRFTAASRSELKQAVTMFKAERHIYFNSMLFADCLERYINEREGIRSPSTIHGYRSVQRAINDKYPAFCGLPVDRITDRDVQVVVSSLKRDGYSPKTIRNWIGLINAVLIAERQSPVKVAVPARVTTDRPIPTKGEITMMLCLMHNHPLEVPFRLALMGLRRGEICALTLDDLDDDDVLHIHRSAVISDDYHVEIKDSPKTDASNRYIQLPKDLADQIREKGITSYYPNSLTISFQRFLRRYKFPPYRLHDCRHFFASYCHSIGIPEADILAGGGWKTSNVMRQVYRHSLAANEASKAIASVFSRR